MADNKVNLEDINKILLVDDTPANLAILRETLAPEGYNLAFAANGEKALEIASHIRPDLILLDIMMPGMDGFETCRRLKSNEATRNIPIIFISAKNEPEDIVEGFHVGGIDYIVKPFRREEVLARVRTHLQLQILALQRENLIADLEEKNQKLRELNDLKNKFLGMAAHDLRNPITAISGYSGLLLTDKKSFSEEKHDEFIGIINKTSQQMSSLVNDMLDISVIESGKLELHLQRGQLGKLIEERIGLIGFTAGKKNIQIHKTIAPIPEILFDANRIGQVLDNLISNALKFSPPGSTVHVSLERKGDKACVSVKDEGAGIPLDEQSKLFQGFQKTSVRPTSGEKSTGLGLAIAKKMVEAHHGTIGVSSKVGSGSIFSFELPIKAV